MNKKTLLFLIIFTLSFLLRAQETISRNFIFLIDQGRDMIAVRSIVFDHHLTLIGPYTSLQGVFQGPLWYYLLSVPTFITNGDPWGSVVLMLLLSLSILLIVFFRLRADFGNTTALLTAFLFAVCPEAVAAATYSWNPHPMWLLIPVSTLSFYEVIKKRYGFHLFLWPTLSLMFHFETALAVFLLLSYLIVAAVFYRENLKTKFFLCGIGIACLFFLPQIVFDIRHNFLMSSSVLKIFAGSKQGLLIKGESLYYPGLVNNHVAAFFENFRSGFSDGRSIVLFAKLLSVVIVFFLLFGKKYKLFTTNEYKFGVLLARILIVVYLLSFLYPFPIRYWFLTGFQSYYLLLFGLVLGALWRHKRGRIFVLVTIVIFMLPVLRRLQLLYITPPNDGGVAKIKGKIDAIDYVYNKAQGKNFGLLVFTPPVNTDAYDYLIWWHGNKQYGYVPHSNKKGEFYLLIEPDPGQSWTYQGWLDTVIKTGEIKSTVTLPSGFIIQQRHETL